MKATGYILTFVGFLVLLGTAGASDTGAIPFGQIVGQAAAGLAMVGAGVVCARVAEAIEKVKEERNLNE